MSDAITLIVLVAAGEGADATTQAMVRATREALGTSSRVMVRETTATPDDAEALAAERTGHPDAVVELAWTDGPHRQATLRVHVTRTGRWVDRSIGFRPTDAGGERGRTLGFAVASILPEGRDLSSERSDTDHAAAPIPAALPSGSAPPAAAGAPGSNGSAGPSGSVAPATEPPRTAGGRPRSDAGTAAAAAATPEPRSDMSVLHAGRPDAKPEAPAEASARAPAPRTGGGAPRPQAAAEPAADRSATSPFSRLVLPTLAVDALFAFAAARCGGLGAEVHANLLMLPFLSMRLGAGYLHSPSCQPAGLAPATPVESTSWTVDAGVAAHPLRATRAIPFGVAVRADLVGAQQDLNGVARPLYSNWSIEALGEVSWAFQRQAEALVAGGAQVALGPRDVGRTGTATTYALPPARALAETGIRVRF